LLRRNYNISEVRRQKRKKEKKPNAETLRAQRGSRAEEEKTAP
jgi:hypothetical protein